MSSLTFNKHVYGRQRKYNLTSIQDFDPRPVENQGSGQACMQSFLKTMKGEGLGVSVPFDKDM